MGLYEVWFCAFGGRRFLLGFCESLKLARALGAESPQLHRLGALAVIDSSGRFVEWLPGPALVADIR